ncbi:hypothetical protein MJG53_008101 [Ovis ammon polii x Ovis aries]|uniref:Uncharacterized protein n=1 Tax=Ovis ammon polii x Ovis aries TaxID=2918886 RepID=A0ACB9UZB5_9CETA|nr:hypothetical protein MJG53_008101 [Ovis ammon polii x Ovis aries]
MKAKLTQRDNPPAFSQLECGGLHSFVKGNRKCELNCQAMGYRFYVRQAEKVIDGTPCDQNGTAICVSGQCKTRNPQSFEMEFKRVKEYGEEHTGG